MTHATSMPVDARLRQFRLRGILVGGMLWGVLPLLTIPFITRGNTDSTLDVWAAVVNGFTVLPASVLAFWYRRTACIWLTINAGLVAASMISFTYRNQDYRIGSIVGAGGSVLLAILVDLAEIRHWPRALEH